MRTTHACFSLRFLIASILVWNFATALRSQSFGEDEKTLFSLGAISPVVLEKDGIEVNFVHVLSSFWTASYFGQNILDRSRSTILQNALNVSYGFSEKQVWDLGAEVRYASYRFDENARSSPFRVLGSDSQESVTFRSFTTLGLRLRAMPFEALPQLTLQGSVGFPVGKDQEAELLNADRIQTSLGGTFFQEISPRFNWFAQARWRTLHKNQDNPATTHSPDVGVYLVAALFQQKIYVFPGIAYAATYQKNYSGGRLRNLQTLAYGSLGMQFQADSALGIFVFAQKPWYMDGQSISTKVVRSSYVDLAVGLRSVF